MRFLRPAVLCGVSALALSACGANSVTDTSEQVGFSSCSEVECSGTLPSGADFEILLPEEWGGTLAIYSHGPRAVAESADPVRDNASVTPTSTVSAAAVAGGPEPAPMWGSGETGIADAMLQAGYAIAGASISESGWRVADQIEAAQELHEYFDENIAEPNRTYVWGESTGGLASARLAELSPDWVAGAAGMCAPMAGPRPTYSLSLDVTYAFAQLFDSKLRLVDYPSAVQARQAYTKIERKVEKLVQRAAPQDQAQITFLAGIARLPLQSRTQSGTTPASALAAYADGILLQARQSTVERYAFEQLVGGNAATNVGTNYAERLAPAQVAFIDQQAPGQIEAWLSALEEGERIEAQPEAVERAAAQGELVGDLDVPLLTLHNTSDATFIAQSESWYRVRTEQNGIQESANFVDTFVLPPVAYGPEEPAKEGAGNCVFTPRTALGVMILLNDWVRRDQYPGQDTVGEAFAQGQVSITYEPGPWPQMGLSPLDPPVEPG
ncbi:MAG: lysophospholipase [Actinomycetia bacterium]|nr:lysophospholipase [Actinomycetes bacterium]